MGEYIGAYMGDYIREDIRDYIGEYYRGSAKLLQSPEVISGELPTLEVWISLPWRVRGT